jgi:hypothetical protein
MDKSIETIVYEVEKQINRVLNNNIPCETCPVKREKAKWKREKVVEALVVRLGAVGPTLIK